MEQEFLRVCCTARLAHGRRHRVMGQACWTVKHATRSACRHPRYADRGLVSRYPNPNRSPHVPTRCLSLSCRRNRPGRNHGLPGFVRPAQPPLGHRPQRVSRTPPFTTAPANATELSGWVRTEALTVRDLDRSPIATGAALSMASMPEPHGLRTLGRLHILRQRERQ